MVSSPIAGQKCRPVPLSCRSPFCERFEASSFYRETPGDVFVHYLAHIERTEWDRYLMTVSEWSSARFSLF